MSNRTSGLIGEGVSYALIVFAFVLAISAFASLRAADDPAAPRAADQETAADMPAAGFSYYDKPELYTEADAQALAKMAWGECRGVKTLTINGKAISSKCQQAAAMWCALNRYDAGGYESIAAVVAAPSQFVGYDPEHPLDDELLALTFDVLERWQKERHFGGDVGRVLPADYLFFTGDGEYNYFTQEWRSLDYYTWELPDVYAEACDEG